MEDALFRNNVSFRNVSKRHGVTVSALFRHKQHVGEQKVRALRAVAEITAELPPKKQAYVDARIAGKSKKQAALEAGYSKAMAEHPAKIETPDVKMAFTELIQQAIPPERGTLETKFFSHEGVVQDKREVVNWSERRQYAAMAAEMGGYHVPDKSDRDQGGPGVILILPDPPKPAPVIEDG
jgi:hypothetical protein